MKKILLGITVILFLITWGCIKDEEPQGPSLIVGDSLPFFSVTMNNGEIISTSSLNEKTSVIVFFNTNCKDCQKELPVIQQLWEMYCEDPEVIILPISREENAEEIEKYWSEHNFSMPWSAQENREVYSLFAQSIIPRIYIADPQGKITAVFDDQDMPDVEVLKNFLP